jgi:hypothetical protein
MSNNFEFLFMGVLVFPHPNEKFSITHGYVCVKKLTDVNHPFLF